MNLKRLKDCFSPDAVEWRVQQSGKKGDKQWALVLCYVTNRAIMDRLDEVCGAANWKNEYKSAPDGGVLCGLSIRIGDEWVTKWDGAENTDIEATKGGLSNSMKRAAVQWGIGRYLYKLEANFVEVTEKGDRTDHRIFDKKTKVEGYWKTPKLPDWAVPQPLFKDLPKARQDKARAQFFAIAKDLGRDAYELAGDLLGYDEAEKRGSLTVSTVKQVSNAINHLKALLADATPFPDAKPATAGSAAGLRAGGEKRTYPDAAQKLIDQQQQKASA